MLPAFGSLIFAVDKPSTAKTPALIAELRPLPPAPVIPPLKLAEPDEPTPAPPLHQKKPPPKPQPDKPAKAPSTWTQVVKQHLKKLDAAGQFYPAEAIARGLQGDVEILMMLDESGKVVAARIERESGHPMLDQAALRAVRSLSSLPADAPRQVVLPVRFRLR